MHNVYVIKRPGVDHFLKKMGELYEIVVFTASLSKVSLGREIKRVELVSKDRGGFVNMTIFLCINVDLLCPQYADPVLDMLDIHRVVKHRLFRESCYNHKGNYVKACILFLLCPT